MRRPCIHACDIFPTAKFKAVDIMKTVSEGQVSDVCFINIKSQALTVTARTRDGTAVGMYGFKIRPQSTNNSLH